MRWKVESVFSDLKRMFGDNVRARKIGYIVAELNRKIGLFNRLKELRHLCDIVYSIEELIR